MSSESDRSTASLLLTSDDEHALIERHWCIEVIEGPDAGKRSVFAGGPVIVGTKSDGFQLTDTTVSRRHMEVLLTAEGVLVSDLGSTNGVKVRRERVDHAFVAPGASVSIGSTTLRFSPIDRPVSTATPERFGEFITASPGLKQMLGRLQRVARSDTTVLIEGETGTGKELLARAIHATSSRKQHRMVVIDCRKAADTLLEIELFFGHEFEAADGSTLFLDELSELPLELQPKLLQVLETRRVRRPGYDREKAVDVRVVAATRRDLAGLVMSSRFRSDLYSRIAVVRVRVPPLRERPEDVSILAAHHLATLGADHAALTPEAFDALCQYHWPGNGRELRDVLERALSACPVDSPIRAQDLFAG